MCCMDIPVTVYWLIIIQILYEANSHSHLQPFTDCTNGNLIHWGIVVPTSWRGYYKQAKSDPDLYLAVKLQSSRKKCQVVIFLHFTQWNTGKKKACMAGYQSQDQRAWQTSRKIHKTKLWTQYIWKFGTCQSLPGGSVHLQLEGIHMDSWVSPPQPRARGGSAARLGTHCCGSVSVPGRRWIGALSTASLPEGVWNNQQPQQPKGNHFRQAELMQELSAGRQ